MSQTLSQFTPLLVPNNLTTDSLTSLEDFSIAFELVSSGETRDIVKGLELLLSKPYQEAI